MQKNKIVWTANEIAMFPITFKCTELNACQDCDIDFCNKVFLDADFAITKEEHKKIVKELKRENGRFHQVQLQLIKLQKEHKELIKQKHKVK